MDRDKQKGRKIERRKDLPKRVGIYYRKYILLINKRDILPKMETVSNENELIKPIDLLNVIYFIKNTSEKISLITITNHFGRVGFEDQGRKENYDFDLKDNLSLSVIAKTNTAMMNWT